MDGAVMRIVLLGAPGSGKGTQAGKLSEYYGIPLISSVSVLKEAAAAETEAGLQARIYQDHNQHVPDEILLLALRDRLLRPDIHNGFLLVGFPRTAAQADALDGLLEELNLPLDLVLRLEGDPDHFMERLEGRRICQSCGAMYNVFTAPPIVEEVCDLCGGRVKRRADDNEETIASRMRIYESQSASLIRYYALHGKLRQTDGSAGDDAVFRALRQILDEHPPTVIETEPVSEPPVPIRLQQPEAAPAGEARAAMGDTASESTATPAAAEEKRSGRTAAKKPAAKKAAAKKAAPKKTAPKRTAAKSPPAKKTAAKKKAVPGKGAAATMARKKAPARVGAAKKAAGTASAKRPAAKKSGAEKSATKQAAPEKAAVKRDAPVKAAPKKAATAKAPAQLAQPKRGATGKRAAGKGPLKKPPAERAAAAKAAPKKAAAKRAAPGKGSPKKAATGKVAKKTSTTKPATPRPQKKGAPKTAATRKVAKRTSTRTAARPAGRAPAKKALKGKVPAGKAAARPPAKRAAARKGVASGKRAARKGG